MKKFLLFLMFALFCVPWAANAQVSIPYTEGFENMSSADDLTAAGWISSMSSTNSFLAIETSTSNVNTGSKALDIDSWDATSSDYVIVGLPVFDAAINTLQISFSYRVTSTSVAVGYLTDADDASTFVSLQSYSGSSSYTTKTVELSEAPATAARIAIKYTGYYRCYVDDIEVKALPSCLKPTSVTATSDGNVTWEGEGRTWNLNYKASSASTWTEVNGLTSMSYTIPDLASLTTYSVRVQNVCDDNSTTDWTYADDFTTPAGIPLVETFNSTSVPTAWTRYSGLLSGVMDGTVTLGTITSGWNFGTGNSVFDNHAKVNIYGTSCKYWLVTPALTMENNVQLSFDVAYTAYSGSGAPAQTGTDDKFVVLITTDGGTTWTILRQWDNAGSEYVLNNLNPTPVTVTYDLSSYAGQSIAVAFYVESTESNADNNLHIDNVSIDYIPSCFKPTDLNATNITTNSAELSWTANSGESAWTVYYKKASDENYTEVANVTANPYTLSGLTAATNYQYYVVANCSANDASEASNPFTFVTECDVIAALGYSENFDGYTAAAGVLPICWNKINTTTYSYYQGYPRVYSSSANSNPNCLYFYSYAYYSGGTTTYDPQPQYAILTEMTGLNGKQVTLMAKGSTNTSTFKIGTMSDPTDASTFQLIAEQALTTSYDEYSFIVNQEGNYLAIMIDAANESRTSNGAYIDDISIDNAPTCFKPSSPMLETPASRTAHTATLKWTNGEEGQNAWQIAYSTTADFNPDEVTPVDVTTNPATINGLDANTTYYAYVRANCGNDDLSAWSRTKATFTTTAANAAPTGLAVDASSITSESAMVTWTGVATNDYHDSYELYFSTETTMPEELVAENLITGITAESYELTHLEAETPYYLWVRDNCGNDGLSAWSSRASFTTASSCQTPDGLAESNVTNESATITWNTYGLNEFNLRYSTDGENWTVEENVNTPYTLDHLTASTTYQVQVQATCADAETWSAVLSFTTACDAIADLPWNENFDAYTGSTSSSVPTGYPNDEMPNCWQFLNRSDNSSTYPQVFISSNSGYPVSGKCLFFKSSSSTPLYAVLPAFEEEIANLQLTFTYRNEGTSESNGTLIVGYMTNPADATTFTTVLTCEKTTTLTEKEVLFTEAPAGSYVTFMYQGGSSNNYYMSIDNVSVDYIPTCQKPTELAVTTNALNATITWVSEVGTYDVAYATDATANPDENIAGTATEETYTMNALALGDHYFWVRANCGNDGYSEWVGPVSAHIGYCVPNPSSRDGKGITSVVFGTGDNVVSNVDETNGLPSAAPYYGDYSSMVGAMHAGVGSTVSITYATGSSTVYSYGTIIWVDWDNSLSFEDNEIVYTGTSNQGSGGAPQVLEASFTVPADQATGEYRMRIAGADSYFDSYIGGTATGNHSACFSSSYAVCHDYTLRVLEAPSCMMPTNVAVNYTGGTEATISWTSDAEAWNMRVNGVDVNGVITNPYTLTGLELATTYSVEVQANCGEDGTSEWSNAVSFTTDFCMPENQCEITFELTDGYGDGWNGGAGIRVIDVETNAEIGFMTNEDLDGESYDVSELNTLTLAVCDGREIQFVWVSGTYDDECSYVVKDANGEVIFSGQYTDLLDEPVNYVVNCSAPVPVCTITLDENNEWFENFDNFDIESTERLTGTTMGDCWTWNRLVELPTDYVDTVPQIYNRSAFAHSGDYSLLLWHRGVYAMPELDSTININELKMSFYLRQSYSFYTLLVGVMTDPTDPETFEPIAHVDNGTSTAVEYIELDFANYQGEGRYIAFKNVRPTATEFDGDWNDIHSVNYIDDIKLSLKEEGYCVIGLPYPMDFDDVTSSTNALTGAMPECWEMVQNDLDEEIPFDKMPQVYCKSSYANSGNYSLRMVNRCIYAMPLLADTIDMSKVQLSMTVRQPNARYQLYVGVWSDGEFYPVALVDNESTGYEEIMCDFSKYDGPAGRIAFRNVLSKGKAFDYSYNYIDDIVVFLGETPVCDAVTSLNVTESFEDYTQSTVAATGVMPTCWEVVAKDVEMEYNKYPQICNNPNFAGTGDYSLAMIDRCVIAMPELEDGIELNDVTLTMTLRQPYTQYQLEVGVWEVGYDENQEPIDQFVPVATFHNADNTVTEVSCDFASYTGNGTRIAFRNTLKSGNYNYSYNYLDDITLTLTEAKIAESSSANVIDEIGVERYLEGIVVYPNPTVGELHIGAVDVQKVECYNQMGQLVAVYNNDRDINISALADGVYTLRITVPQGVTMRKVVKR